eukprot:TRINITY_DN7508_c0_g1_i1.p1 TRINITY_DN7508_c0_g1~~TRINITY_DN7508_c0_g1_i1.p1  ORF type:complete len:167 (-),score=37.54 TRINITY_DN7508_c0_g1_i1:9-509(-)
MKVKIFFSDLINSKMELGYLNESIKNEGLDEDFGDRNQWKGFENKHDMNTRLENYMNKFVDNFNEMKIVLKNLEKIKYKSLNEDKEDEFIFNLKGDIRIIDFIQKYKDLLQMYLIDLTSKQMILIDTKNKKRRTFMVYKSNWSMQPSIDKNKKQLFIDLIENYLSV